MEISVFIRQGLSIRALLGRRTARAIPFDAISNCRPSVSPWSMTRARSACARLRLSRSICASVYLAVDMNITGLVEYRQCAMCKCFTRMGTGNSRLDPECLSYAEYMTVSELSKAIERGNSSQRLLGRKIN